MGTRFTEGRKRRVSEGFEVIPPMPIPEGAERWIVCAACRYGDLVIPGIRHFDICMVNLIGKWLSQDTIAYMDSQIEEQGFLDNYGNYVNRADALIMTKANGQYGARREPSNHHRDAFSEDLW